MWIADVRADVYPRVAAGPSQARWLGNATPGTVSIVGRRAGLAVGQREPESLGHRAGEPQDGVLAGEPATDPGGHGVRAEPVECQLVVAGTERPALAGVPEAVPAQRTADRWSALGSFLAQDPPLEQQPVERRLGQPADDLLEERLHLVGPPDAREHGLLPVDEPVVVVVLDAEAREREMLDDVGHAAQRRRLVAATDAEHERGDHRSGLIHPQRADTVDLGALDRRHGRHRRIGHA